MGNAVASVLGEAPPKEVRLSVANKQALATLGLGDKEVGVLVKYFQHLDDTRTGVVAVEDFSEKVGVQARFVERIFDITDGACDGALPFLEFVLSLWGFCTLDVSELATALFQSYDRDGNGTLSVAELSDLSKDLQPHGRQLGPKLRQALAKFDEILERQEKMRYEHNMARAKQRLQSGGGAAQAGGVGMEEPPLEDPAEIRISPEFLTNFLRKNSALGQPLEQFHVLARQDVLGNKAWAGLRRTRLSILASECADKKGIDALLALREHLLTLRNSAPSADGEGGVGGEGGPAAASADAEPQVHADYLDLTDSDEEENEMRSARVKAR